MPLDYEAKIRKAYRKNRTDVVRAMDAGELDKKINNFCDKHGFTRKKVMDEIRNNKIVATFFAKDPSKQRLHERIAADSIKSIKGVNSFKDLSNNKFHVVKGEIIERKILKKRGIYARAKTIDFYWKYGGAEFWAAHKYTKEEGGAQGNQYKDLQEFLIQSKGTKRKKTFFIAIADGEFYQNANGQTNILRIEKLKELADEPSLHACTLNELEALMKKITS